MYVMPASGQASCRPISSSANMYAVSFLAFRIATPFFPLRAHSSRRCAATCFKSPRTGSMYACEAAPRRRSTSFAAAIITRWRSISSPLIHPASAAASSVESTPAMFSGYPAWISTAIVGVAIPALSIADCRSSPMIMETQVPITAIRSGEKCSSAYRSTSTSGFSPPKMNSLSASEVVSTRIPSSSRSRACLNEQPDGPCRIATFTLRSRAVYSAATIELGRGCMNFIVTSMS